MSAKKPVSYFGIGSCILFAIATGIILAVVIASRFASHKLAGYEIVILGPVALLIYIIGVVLSINGLAHRDENPGSLVGLILNILPFLLFGLRLAQMYFR